MNNGQDITIRRNRRMVATFDDQENLNRWLRFYGDDFNEPYMYTIHGLGTTKCLDKYLKTL